MSYANGTQYYNLPQTVGTDKRDWFDTNSAFAAVDAALHAAVTGQAADAEAISTINASLATDEVNIAALQTASTTQAASISTLQTTVNAQASQIADVRQDAEDMITANNEGAAATSTRAYSIGDYFIYNDVLYKATAAIAVGDTIVPNTNCEATNVDTEITAVKSALTKKTISVTADGVKTRAQLLNELVNLIDTDYTLDRARNSIISRASNIYRPETISLTDLNNIGVRYCCMQVGTTSMTFNQLTLVKVSGTANSLAYRGTSDNMADVSSEVEDNGVVLSLMY